MYLVKGFECARKDVISRLNGQIEKVLEVKKTNKDYQSQQQAWVQKNRGKVPTYFLDRVKGPEHNPTFYVKVFIGQKAYGPASGSNKKQAEQNAARLALISLNVISED